MLSNAIGWYFRQRHDELWKLANAAVQNQLDLLEYFTEKLSRTEYGQKHDIHSSVEYEEFVGKIPVVGYEELKSYILRSMDGEQQIIWPGEITWFAKSSGTTSNEAKFIPITYEALEYNHFRGTKEPITQYYTFFPEANIFNGKALLIGGSHKVNQINPKSYYGDLSAVLMTHMPAWATWKSTPDTQIAIMDNWEEKVERMAHATIKENVTSISGAPTWAMVLLERILEITGKNHIHEVWPNLELFIHGGMSFEPYRQRYKELIPGDHMHYVETYNASEGFFGAQAYKDQRDLLLMTHHGVFYEFYPVSKGPDFTVPLWKVEPDINYAVVVTTCSGLWRYTIGDTIMFTKTQPYLFKITGRVKLFINAFGEELIIENAETAMADTCREFGVRLIDYTAAPRFEEVEKGHEWIIELETIPTNTVAFVEYLDARLQEVNSDYAGKRIGNLLMKLPKVHFAQPGTFKNWLSHKGKLGGQNKVPRLSNHRAILEEVLEFL